MVKNIPVSDMSMTHYPGSSVNVPPQKPRLRAPLFSLTSYDLHKRLINNYLLSQKGSTVKLQRDTSRDKRDIDVVRENHKFLWDDVEVPESWEERVAKKYYDKLFKEFCVCDLSRYKENKVAMRWRTEQELVDGKGQFICGEKRCQENENLRSWEVNFAYVEHGEKKNALVKARLCEKCSKRLNYHHLKREIKSRKRKKHVEIDADEEAEKKRRTDTLGADDTSNHEIPPAKSKEQREEDDASAWKNMQNSDEKSREEEFQDYLEDLLF